MNKLLEMSKEELEERTKELLQIDQVDLILKYLYQEQRIDKAIEYIKENADDNCSLNFAEELLDILKGSDK